jgi:hypothetical protein
MSKYKIIVPKPAALNAEGTEVGLYSADDVVDAKEDWQDGIMKSFVDNGWAMEIKTVEPEVTADAEVTEVSLADTVEAEEAKAAPKKRKPRAKTPKEPDPEASEEA